MLRYFYFLSLLICIIHLSFCYEYARENVPSNRPRNKKSEYDTSVQQRKRNYEQRKFRKRRDFDIEYDKDPVAQIDVANFIKSPDDGYLEENDPYEFHFAKVHRKTYNDYGSPMEKNPIEKVDGDDNYSDMEADNLEGSSHSSHLDTSFEKIYNDNEPTRVNDDDFRSKSHDSINNEYSGHYQEKKCALKNIKFPFFSHKKIATIKENNKKRKLINTLGTEKVTKKSNDDDSAKQNSVREKKNSYNYYNVNKRSYIELLCPACRKKFISKSKKIKDSYNTQLNHNDVRYTEFLSGEGNTQNINTAYSDDIEKFNIAKEDYENYIKDKRSKREDDNRNTERQKELEDLEKRVESVPVNSPPAYNKIDLKA